MGKTHLQTGLALLLSNIIALTLLIPAASLAQEAATRPDIALEIRENILVGEPVVAHFSAGDFTMPVGSYASINITVLEGPQGAKTDILPGYPDSRMVFHQPGTYEVQFQLSQMSKGSCAGLDARPLYDSRQTMVVSNPNAPVE